MKPHELRQLSDDELLKRIADEEQGLANLRFQKVLGQLEKPHRISEARKDIARMRTLLRARTITTTAKKQQ